MITKTEAFILKLLVAKPTGAYPSELVHESEGKLKRGTIYALLADMEKRGLVSSKQIEATATLALPRTLYSITATGQIARVEIAKELGFSINVDPNLIGGNYV